MNDKKAPLGIGAALLGVLAALVGAALAGRAVAKGKGQSGEGATSPEPVAPARPGAESPEADGLPGHTAPAQPAPTGQEGHPVPDLAAGNDIGPDHRAPEAFRPDMDAPMTAAEREALRPATGPAPSLVAPQGGSIQGPGGDRY
ncbi:hypothetical protein [Sphingomonas sp.]|jgi:hypothetical protein|uniref:hypothetical protein n=1 Tax=Sphingomonas sp. TaxID=28214 RepID=UPI002D807AFB|nr:hypothetical protein [Sphingomonas sp.]HEU0045876.1 hypothetical protein [Sphingomonas sp.]